MITVTQALVGIVALVMAYTVFVDYKRSRLGVPAVAFWGAVWLGLILLVFLPGPFLPVAHILELPRLLDLVVIAGILLLGVVTYRSNVRLEQLSQRLDRLVSDLALAEFKASTTSSADPSGD